VNPHHPQSRGASSHARSALQSRTRTDPQFAADDSSIRSRSPRPQSAHPGEKLALTSEEQQRFHALYREHFNFVFRNLRRLGVSPASTDDALQEVYLVVLRRIRDLQQGTHTKAWLFAIILRIASNQRRSVRRRGTLETLADHALASAQPGPFDLTARAQAANFLHTFLDSLGEQRRAVFIMAELEQLTVPEIARVLAANPNTVYSWLRTARIAFSKTLEQARSAGWADHG
jgi:RNA polymerase sigma-70 factor (ECF subfamily)